MFVVLALMYAHIQLFSVSLSSGIFLWEHFFLVDSPEEQLK